MEYGTKAAIRAQYLAGLESAYPWAKEGSPHRASGMAAATKAVDAALAGKIKLEGDVWRDVLAANGLPKNATRAQISSLPEGSE